MFKYKVERLAKITNGIVHGNDERIVENIVTDSRSVFVNDNSLFIALSGQNHDGHSFLTQMYTRGVRSFIVQFVPHYVLTSCSDASFVIVENSLVALQSIAADYRSSLLSRVVGITGSNGKTIVKEWLYYVLSKKHSICKSPKSYNSQIGVPISMVLMQEDVQFAFLEAGISQAGEMQKLKNIIKPNKGVFTYLGDAHSNGFLNREEKVNEKCKLFHNAESVVCCSDDKLVVSELKKLKAKLFGWSKNDDGAFVFQKSVEAKKNGSEIVLHSNKTIYTLKIPFIDVASVYNATTVATFILSEGLNLNEYLKFFENLPAIEMRLHQLPGENNCTIIDDSYSADLQSLKIALDFFMQQSISERRTIVLSDLSLADSSGYDEVASLLNSCKISKLIGIGTAIRDIAPNIQSESYYFDSTARFLNEYDFNNFSNEIILIKGARAFQFEHIVARLQKQSHQTVLEINLNALEHNLRYFRSKISPETKIMAMVKALSYGSGGYEIANLLQHQRIDYLAVAFADEGIALRKSGISTPIAVMNPALEDFSSLIQHELEPEIYSFRMLNLFNDAVKQQAVNNYPVHIKIDTGMARYGFAEAEISQLISMLKESNLKVASVFSHLSGSDEKIFDEFTQKQIDTFEGITEQFKSFGSDVIFHILNSAGIERFPHAQFSMVRLGIGLYGVSAKDNSKLMHVSTLKTTVSQIRHMPAGETVGYSRKGKVEKDSRIAVLPIGYADGLRRSFSNGVGGVIINGNYAPFIGNICMDACMVDISGISVKEGDEAIVFGSEQTISELAQKANTIPYEILTNVSSRVKRVYVRE